MTINEGNPVPTATFSSESMTTSTGSLDDDSTTASQLSPSSSTSFIGDCVYRGEGNANIVVALPQVRRQTFFLIIRQFVDSLYFHFYRYMSFFHVFYRKCVISFSEAYEKFDVCNIFTNRIHSITKPIDYA